MKQLTTSQVAAVLGVTTQNVHKLALKHGIGKPAAPWSFTPRDVEALRARQWETGGRPVGSGKKPKGRGKCGRNL